MWIEPVEQRKSECELKREEAQQNLKLAERTMKMKFERVFKKLKKDFRHKTTIAISYAAAAAQRKEPQEKLVKEKRLQDVQETHKKEPQEVLGRQK